MDDTAFRIYKLAAQGFCCSQIIIKMALDEEEKENIDLIKAANGLCAGIGYSRKTCGAITGSICVLGLYAGKGERSQSISENFISMIREYMEWFEDEFESTECSDLIGSQVISDDSGNISYPVKCGDTIIKSYEKIQEILFKYEYEFGDRE